jgi:hypothetical protein
MQISVVRVKNFLLQQTDLMPYFFGGCVAFTAVFDVSTVKDYAFNRVPCLCVVHINRFCGRVVLK